MPGDGARAVREIPVDGVVAGAAVHEVDLGEAVGRAGGGVDVVAGKGVRQLTGEMHPSRETYRPKYPPNSNAFSILRSAKS